VSLLTKSIRKEDVKQVVEDSKKKPGRIEWIFIALGIVTLILTILKIA
jgi:hypothetical protein